MRSFGENLALNCSILSSVSCLLIVLLLFLAGNCSSSEASSTLLARQTSGSGDGSNKNSINLQLYSAYKNRPTGRKLTSNSTTQMEANENLEHEEEDEEEEERENSKPTVGDVIPATAEQQNYTTIVVNGTNSSVAPNRTTFSIGMTANTTTTTSSTTVKPTIDQQHQAATSESRHLETKFSSTSSNSTNKLTKSSTPQGGQTIKHLMMKQKIARMLDRLDRERSQNFSSKELSLTPRSRKYLSHIKRKRKLKLPATSESQNDQNQNSSSTSLLDESNHLELGEKMMQQTPVLGTNLSESASQMHEKWVKFGGHKQESPPDEEEEERKDLDEKSNEADRSDRKLVEAQSKSSSVRASKTGQSEQITKSNNNNSNKLPPKLRAKIIEQFLKSGGKPQNIALSDSTITTTTQSRKKTVTTIYRIVPALDEPSGVHHHDAAAAAAADDDDDDEAVSRDNYKSLDKVMLKNDLGREHIGGSAKTPNLTGGDKHAGRKLKKIMVTRVEIPQSEFLSDSELGQRELDGEQIPIGDKQSNGGHSLGEFYRGPHASLMGVDTDEVSKTKMSSNEQRQRALQLDKLIETKQLMQEKKANRLLSSSSKQQQQQHRATKSASLLKAKSQQQQQLTNTNKVSESLERGQQIREDKKSSSQNLPSGRGKEKAPKKELNTQRSDKQLDSLEQLKRSIRTTSRPANEQTTTSSGWARRVASNSSSSGTHSARQDEASSRATSRANNSTSGSSSTAPSSSNATPTTTTTTSPTITSTTKPLQVSSLNASSLASKTHQHNIMMLIDFGSPNEQQQHQLAERQIGRKATSSNDAIKLERLAIGHEAHHLNRATGWSSPASEPNEWQPVGASRQASRPATVNVQIFNQQPGGVAFGPPSASNQHHLLLHHHQQQQQQHQQHQLPFGFGPTRPASPSSPSALVKQQMRLEPARLHQDPHPAAGWPPMLSAGAQHPQLTAVDSHDLSTPFLFASSGPAQLGGRVGAPSSPDEMQQPLESAPAGSLILPGESAQTNQLIQRVIDELTGQSSLTSFGISVRPAQNDAELGDEALGEQLGAEQLGCHQQLCPLKR